MTINQYDKTPRCRGPGVCTHGDTRTNTQAHVRVKTQPCGKHTESIMGWKGTLKVNSSMSASLVSQSITATGSVLPESRPDLVASSFWPFLPAAATPAVLTRPPCRQRFMQTSLLWLGISVPTVITSRRTDKRRAEVRRRRTRERQRGEDRIIIGTAFARQETRQSSQRSAHSNYWLHASLLHIHSSTWLFALSVLTLV